MKLLRLQIVVNLSKTAFLEAFSPLIYKNYTRKCILSSEDVHCTLYSEYCVKYILRIKLNNIQPSCSCQSFLNLTKPNIQLFWPNQTFI